MPDAAQQQNIQENNAAKEIDAVKNAEKNSKQSGKNDKAGKSKSSAILRVRALHQSGFRRAGRHFTQAWSDIARDELTDEQYQALVSEPRLAVEEVAG